MPRCQWRLMRKTASWVLSLDLNPPSPSQGSAQQLNTKHAPIVPCVPQVSSPQPPTHAHSMS